MAGRGSRKDGNANAVNHQSSSNNTSTQQYLTSASQLEDGNPLCSQVGRGFGSLRGGDNASQSRAPFRSDFQQQQPQRLAPPYPMRNSSPAFLPTAPYPVGYPPGSNQNPSYRPSPTQNIRYPWSPTNPHGSPYIKPAGIHEGIPTSPTYTTIPRPRTPGPIVPEYNPMAPPPRLGDPSRISSSYTPIPGPGRAPGAPPLPPLDRDIYSSSEDSDDNPYVIGHPNTQDRRGS